MPPGTLHASCSKDFRPTGWAAALILICLLPLLAMGLGFDFGTRCELPQFDGDVSSSAIETEAWNDMVHASAHGGYSHTILEWTALCAALSAALLAFCLYSVVRDPSLPVIGIAMLCAGLMDGFHTLAAVRLVHAVAPNTELVPFTWALCRLFNALILVAGIGLFAFGQGSWFRSNRSYIPAACVFFVLAALITMHQCVTAAHLPQTMFEQALVKRPYDILSLVPLIACATIIIPRYLRDNRSYFAWSLLLSMIPQIMTQLYMAFGSSQLHDSCFNIGHGLKVLGYSVPAVGLLLTYQQAFVDLKSAQVRLARTDLADKIAARVALRSTEASAEAEIIFECLRGISELTDRDTGRISLFEPTESETIVHVSGDWHSTADIETRVRKSGRSVPLRRAGTLIAHVHGTQESVWIEDLTKEATGLQPAIDYPACVRSVLAFPMVVNDQTYAVIEFTSNQPLPVDSKLMTTVQNLIDRVERIIERRREQEVLQISEQRFHLAVAGSNDGIWDWDIRTGQTWYSPRFRELLDCDESEVEGLMQQWKERLHKDDYEQATLSLQNHLQGDQPFDVEYRLLCNNGNYRWFRARGQAVWNELCQPIRMAGSLTDITAQKEAEEEIQQAQQALFASEQHLRAMIDATPECVKLVDRDGILLEINAVGLMLTEFDCAEEVIGQSVYEIIAPEDRDKFIAFNERVCDGDRGILEFEIIGGRGTRRTMETSAVPLTLPDGRRVHLGITREITQQKLRNLALRNAKEAAESANRAKSEFLANMSHEIRTPMNGILGMTELALGTSLDDEQTEYLETVRDSGESLLATINDILDFSKVEAGMLRLESAAFSLPELVAATLKPLQLRARQKNLECDWTISDHVPTTVLGDGHRLQQILTNLVGNAIKFTSHGSVKVVIDSEQNGPHWNRLHVKVIDTGVGIPKNKQKTIFDAFSQADYSTTRNFGGTGLGLAITTQLVELMGGSMTVDSIPGQGSTFHFTANFGVCETENTKQQPDDVQSPECRPLNVLLAEDNRVNQRFAQRLLEKQGHQVTIAEDGRKAVELAKQMVPDVVLMDIQMPELDGYQATQAIRRLQANGMAYVPIVAMTAHAMKGDREKCLEQGMDDYVTKPVRKAELFRVLAQVTSEAPAAAASP